MAGDGITAGRQRNRANGSGAPVGGLRVERVCGAYAMNVVTLASA